MLLRWSLVTHARALYRKPFPVGGAAALAAAASVAASFSAVYADASAAPSAPGESEVSNNSTSSSSLTAPFTMISDMVYDNIIAPYAEPSREKLLPDLPANLKGREKPTLVISLDGTLIESQWYAQWQLLMFDASVRHSFAAC